MPKQPSASEASLEAYFRRAIRDLGGQTIKVAPVEAGIPDRMVFLSGGRIFMVELKTETGQLSPIQRVTHARLLELGTTVVVLSGRRDIDAWVASLSR